MATNNRSLEELLAENVELRYRLEEAEETLLAIRSGAVDALVVSMPEGEQVFTLEGADQPYRILVETMSEGAATLAPDGTILYCNNRLATMLEVPLERLMGTQLCSKVAPEDLPIFHARLESCMDSCSKDEIILITGEGKPLPVLISCCAIDLSGSHGINVVITDLSEQKRNEEIVASEKLARSIIDQAGEAIIVCDENGIIIRASLLAHKLCGENPLLKPFDGIFPLQLAGKGEYFSSKATLQGKIFRNVDVILNRRDNKVFHLLLNGSPLKSDNDKIIGCVLSLPDITERIKAEEALQESERRWATTLASIGDAVIATDMDARITFMNAVAEELTGWSLGEAMRKPVKEVFRIINEYSRKTVDDPVTKVLEAGMIVGLANHTILIRRDGTEIPLDDSGAPIRDQDGRNMGVVLIFRDITERRRFERELQQARDDLEAKVAERTGQLAQSVESLQKEVAERKKLEQQLLQSQKMESIGLLAGGVAHDFNNLLTGISGFAQLLRDSIRADDELLQESVGHILTAAERAAALTESLLAFSRKQILNRKPLIIENIIDNAGKFIRRVIGEDIEFRTAHSGGELIVLADTAQFEHVLMNLAINSRDAMPDGGCVTISTKAVMVKEGSEAQYDLSVPGRYALITFSDTGTGIDEASIERIFEPFYTSKEIGKGTGLGLSIVYGIIKQHEGSILVKSDPGKGTTFDIYLPLVEGREESEDAKKTVPVAGGSETLLVAEDEEVVKVLMKKLLERAGYKVIVAGNGDEAVALFREHDDISLVLSDVVMPGKNGKELLSEIKMIKPGIKFIFISGYTADITTQKGIFEEGMDFITKPVSNIDLLQKIREVLDRN